MSIHLTKDSVKIREVWRHNLKEEFLLIQEKVLKFHYIALDTEFPGVVFVLQSKNRPCTLKERYDYVKNNVNVLKIIQLGLTFFDEKGNLPICKEGTDNRYCVWQFNFREFDVKKDRHNPKSIKLLRDSGIDLDRNVQDGIDAKEFAELLMSSGAVLNPDTKWVAFDGGQDCGYLIKMLTGKQLPETPEKFLEQIKMFLGTMYDIKVMAFSCRLHGGLIMVGDTLNVDRIGIAHQSGSDSLVTRLVFMKLKEGLLKDTIENFAGTLNHFGRV